MKITWVTRSFLDYRIPVFEKLNQLSEGNLTVIYNYDSVPPRVHEKITRRLQGQAIGLKGERSLSYRSSMTSMANRGFRIPWQAGLLSALHDSRPDVMVSDGFFQWTYAALYERFRHHVPHVMCYERTRHTERNCPRFRSLYRKLAMRWIDVICCNGKLCGEYVSDLGFGGPVTFGHMAADVSGLSAQRIDREAARSNHQVSGTVFLFVGRLIPLKGLKYLLEAWALFKKNHESDSQLIIVGDGGEMKQLKEIGAPHVRFTGACDYDSIGKYYYASDVFIIPTLEDNWSLVVPEAMSCGLPIASSIYNGCYPELVRPENGWVFDPLNIQATADMLARIYAAREHFAEMGEKSRELVQYFTPEHAARHIYQSCEIALAKRK